MGNENGKSHGYEIKTKTGDKRGMGTDVQIYITLISEDGRRSHDLYLDCKWRNDFEAGAIDSFEFGDEVPDIGAIAKIEIHRFASCLPSDWFMEWVEITNHYRPENKPDIFPFQRWVRSGLRFTICRYEIVLNYSIIKSWGLSARNLKYINSCFFRFGRRRLALEKYFALNASYLTRLIFINLLK